MKFFLLACLFLHVVIANATNYYVDPSSTSSTQNGALATPWKTLAQVESNMNLFNPGDFIYFKKGQSFPGSLQIESSGTETAPITFSSYGTAAGMPVFSGGGNSIAISVSYCEYVVIDGIKITDAAMSTTDHSIPANVDIGVNIDGSDHITVKNCDLSLVGGGVNIDGHYNTVDKCIIQNLRMIRNTPTSVNSTDDYGGMAIVISGNNNNITGNQFKDCWANSYDFLYDGGAVEIYGGNTGNNKIMYNTAINCNGFMEMGSGDGGTSNNNLVAYNKLINCGGLVWINNGGQFAISVLNLQFYNNVIVETISQLTQESKLIAMLNTVSTTGIILLKNNIFWLTTGMDVAQSGRFSGGQMVHEDNIYRLGTGSVLNFTQHSSELTTSATIFTNIVSPDPSIWDYRPPTGSPAIDFGQNLGLAKDFAGNPVPAVPNSGILETGTSAPALVAGSTAGTISCNGGTTTVTVTASGGTAPYTGTGTFTAGAGTYSYNVTDAAGFVSGTSITVLQPSVITATIAAANVSSASATTTATVTATGGTGTKTYKFNSGSYQSSNVFTNVPVGSHTITVKDANGCSIVKTFTVSVTTPLTASAVSGMIACNGGTTTVTVSASGGTAPYTGTGTFTAGAGTRSFTVTDVTGTSTTKTVTLSQPAAISVSVSTGTITTYGGSTSVTVTATGGTGTKTYKLNAGSYQSSNTFPGVTAGSHTVTVKDANGCTATKNFTLTQPANPLTVTITKGWILCNGGTTTVTVSASGGTMPYTGTGTFTASAGTRSYTVTDATGIQVTQSVSIVSPPLLSVTASAGTVNTYGGTTTITVTASGGTSTKLYKLNAGSYQSSSVFTNVTAGTHLITVKDVKECTATKSITITQPAAGAFMLSLVSKTNISCHGRTDGRIEVLGSRGTMPYLYKKNGGSYSSANIFSNLAPGVYTITGKDGTGVTKSITVTIDDSQVQCPGSRSAGESKTIPALITKENELNINVFPNPSASEFSLIMKNHNAEKIQFTVTNLNGQKVYEGRSYLNERTVFGRDLIPGIYILTILQGNKIHTFKLVKSGY